MIVVRVIDKLINEVYFGVIPWYGTTNASFILRQLQENYLVKERNLYFAYVDFQRNIVW